MSILPGQRAGHDSPEREDALRSSAQYRVGVLLVLGGMLLLLVGPILPWFHTEPITPHPGLSSIPPTSLLSYLISSLHINISAFVGIGLTYSILALAASLAGIRFLAAVARHQDSSGDKADARVGILASLFSASILGLSIFGLNGMVTLDWYTSRVVLDAGYFVTLAGFVVALVGNSLIALAHKRSA